MFITFEGIEGSGKTTQITMLAEKLKTRGHKVVVTREPGGTEIGDQIRKTLLDAKNKNMAHLCEVLLYYAARAQHLEEKILPNMKDYVILCDRFEESTVAYQGYARGIDPEILQKLGDIVLKGFKADLSVIFDLSVETGLGRAKGRAEKLEDHEKEDRFENEVISFHEKVREGYLIMAKKDPTRFKIVNASQNVDALHNDVMKVIDEVLK